MQPFIFQVNASVRCASTLKILIWEKWSQPGQSDVLNHSWNITYTVFSFKVCKLYYTMEGDCGPSAAVDSSGVETVGGIQNLSSRILHKWVFPTIISSCCFTVWRCRNFPDFTQIVGVMLCWVRSLLGVSLIASYLSWKHIIRPVLKLTNVSVFKMKVCVMAIILFCSPLHIA